MVRPTGPHITVALLLVSLVGYVFVLAPRLPDDAAAAAERTPAGAAKPKPAAEPVAPEFFPAAGKRFVGLTTKEGVYDFKPVDAFQQAIEHQPNVMMFNEGWAVHQFDRAGFDAVAKRNMFPLMSWEPWDYQDDRKDARGNHSAQPRFQLAKIYGGEFDDYITSYANGIKALDYEVGIRLAHEMNGFWYPWGVGVNGNRGGDYVKMWKHVRKLFDDAGVTNVTWVWSANVNLGHNIKLKPLYPGDDLVDWIGLSGYYGTAGTDRYRKPATVFDETIEELQTFTKRPIVFTETAGTDVSGYKARWVGDLFDYLEGHPEVIGFIWYEAVKETDWRLVGSPEAVAAFADRVRDPVYDVTWSKTMSPLIDLPRTKAAASPSSEPSASSPATSSSASSSPPPSSRVTPSVRPSRAAPTRTPSVRPSVTQQSKAPKPPGALPTSARPSSAKPSPEATPPDEPEPEANP